jgi:hypothetical protein
MMQTYALNFLAIASSFQLYEGNPCIFLLNVCYPPSLSFICWSVACHIKSMFAGEVSFPIKDGGHSVILSEI